MDNEVPATETPRLLPLDLRRTVILKVGKSPIVFGFKLISQLTWRTFCEKLVTRVEQAGDERTTLVDEESALVELFDACCEAVEGYAGIEKLSQTARIARVPLRHKIAAASVLRSIGADLDHAELPTLSEYTTVTLDAPWTVGERGQMEMYTGLIHRFKQPTIEQYRRWRAGCARVAVTGTAQKGVTVYPSRLAVALGLYDDLIAEVDGYKFADVQLANDVKLIAEKMDGMHKARAVLALFDRSGEEVAIGGYGEDVEQATDEAAA